jgi:putative ABC transport system permease protein
MRFWETVKVALSSLKANKLRSLLTVLGIVIGIFSIISISTVISMLQNSIEEGLSALGKNTFQIQKFPAMRFGRLSDKIRNRKNITIEDYNRLKKLLVEAKSVGAEQWQFGKIIKSKYESTNPNVQITGVTPEALPNNQWIVTDGRSINNNDLLRYKRVCILGADVSKKIFKFIYPIGQEIKVDGLRLKIIGVFEPQGQAFGQSRDNFVVTPLTTFQNKYGKYSRSVNITVMAYSAQTYNYTIETAIGYMRTIRKVPPGEDNDFDIFSNESLIMQVGIFSSF